MRNEILNKTFTAAAMITPYRICKFAVKAGQVQQSTGGSDKSFAVSNLIGADNAGDRVDLVLMGIPEVEYGGTVDAGDPLTSDAEGRAVVAAAGDVVIGSAMASGVLGDIGSALLGAGTVQG